MSSDSICLERSSSRIAAAKEGYCLVVVQGRGKTFAEQDGRQVQLDPCDIAIFDSTRPYVAELQTGFHHYVLKVPREELRRRLGPIEAFTGLKVSGTSGIGSVASAFIRSLLPQIDDMDEFALQDVAENCLDILTSAYSNAVRMSVSNASFSRIMHLARARSTIRSNIQHNTLSPKYVANVLGISERYLGSLFTEEGTSTNRYIWKVRIDKCKSALADAAQSHRTITEIAFSWGFNDASHFSHLFKEHTGTSPSQFRSAALCKRTAL